MIWNKRSVVTLIALIVLLLLVAVKCTAELPRLSGTETYVDTNGTVVTYKHYVQNAPYALDPKTYALIMAVCVGMLALATNFYRKTARLGALKSRCTVPVSAVISAVRSGRSDGYIGYRYKVYNATYQYEYLGTSYEGNNDCYASRTGSLTGAVRVGETEEIFINPENPRELFDFLAAESLKNGTLLSTALSVMGVLTLLALLFR